MLTLNNNGLIQGKRDKKNFGKRKLKSKNNYLRNLSLKILENFCILPYGALMPYFRARSHKISIFKDFKTKK